jgi:hypothetical protein
MKRTLWLVVTVLALVALTAVPAVAEGGKQSRQTDGEMQAAQASQSQDASQMSGDKQRHRWYGARFALVGEVVAVDADEQTFRVLVDKGNPYIEDYVGQELTIATDESTCFLLYGEPPFESASFDDVEVGSYVGVNGCVVALQAADLFLAKRVMVDVPLPAEE